MEYAILIAKLVLCASMVHVWVVRFGKPGPYRGGNAKTLREEFAAFGLSEATMYLSGALHLIAGTALVVSIWVPFLAVPASAALGFLMAGAVWMHLRAGDPPGKALPAGVLLLLSALVWLAATGVL